MPAGSQRGCIQPCQRDIGSNIQPSVDCDEEAGHHDEETSAKAGDDDETVVPHDEETRDHEETDQSSDDFKAIGIGETSSPYETDDETETNGGVWRDHEETPGYDETH